MTYGPPMSEPTGAPTQQEVISIVMARTANARKTAFWLWLFLGGFNAHIAYLNPRHRWPIVIVSVLLFMFTLGISGCFWLVNWIWLGKGHVEKYRLQVHAEVEADLLRQRQLYGVVS